MSNPYLSIVVVGRNDNYGGDFLSRFQNCIDWNTKWLEHFQVDTEFVFVNWNPVSGQPSIEDQILWPVDRNYVRYRLITVPTEIHNRFIDPEVRDIVPLYEFIAKNVGIRRAKGQYILSMNADILLNPDILKFISRKSLKENSYYRANRLDFQKMTAELSVDNLFQSGFAVFLKGYKYDFVDSEDKKWQYRKFKIQNRIRLRWEAFKLKNFNLANANQWNVVYHNGGFLAHCLASGDFMLMHRSNWVDLTAYPEYTPISTHTDSLLTILAYSKFKERVFPGPVFHQAHERRYGWEDIEKNKKFRKAYDFFERAADDVKLNRPIDTYLNTTDWGVGELNSWMSVNSSNGICP